MTTGWIDENTFSCWVPAQIIEKAGDKDGVRYIQGIASTDSRDLQGEIVDQKGIDFSYFLKHGYFNDDHKSGPENKVGQPTECKITKNGLWVKGFLFNNHKRADHYWELMRALNSSQASRKVGFSIQGKVIRKEGNKIASCWIQDIALTPAPVNTSTWAEIAKSLSTQTWDFNKSQEVAEKAQTATNSPLVSESLEGDKKENREDISKGLTYNQSVEYLHSTYGLDKKTAELVSTAIFSLV